MQIEVYNVVDELEVMSVLDWFVTKNDNNCDFRHYSV